MKQEREGEGAMRPLTQIGWQRRDSTMLPGRAAIFEYLNIVEKRLAGFLLNVDFQAKGELFPSRGNTILSRTLFSLLHVQLHLAEVAMDLQNRGLEPPVGSRIVSVDEEPPRR